MQLRRSRDNFRRLRTFDYEHCTGNASASPAPTAYATLLCSRQAEVIIGIVSFTLRCNGDCTEEDRLLLGFHRAERYRRVIRQIMACENDALISRTGVAMLLIPRINIVPLTVCLNKCKIPAVILFHGIDSASQESSSPAPGKLCSSQIGEEEEN